MFDDVVHHVFNALISSFSLRQLISNTVIRDRS